jgi:hypothetical protein
VQHYLARCRSRAAAYTPSTQSGTQSHQARPRMSDQGAGGATNSPSSTDTPQGTRPLEHLSVRAISQEDISGPFTARSAPVSPASGRLGSLTVRRGGSTPRPRPVAENHSDSHELPDMLQLHNLRGAEFQGVRMGASCSAHCAPAHHVHSGPTAAVADSVNGCRETRSASDGAGTVAEASASVCMDRNQREIREGMQKPRLQEAAGNPTANFCPQEHVESLHAGGAGPRRSGQSRSRGDEAMPNPTREVLQQEFLRLEALVKQM